MPKVMTDQLSSGIFAQIETIFSFLHLVGTVILPPAFSREKLTTKTLGRVFPEPIYIQIMICQEAMANKQKEMIAATAY